MKLCIPEKILDQHVAVLGKTGAGKSSALRHLAEHLLDRKKRVCIIDPKGDWWGLKFDANGERLKSPVVTFGNFKEEKATDIPINDRAGREVAQLIASGNRPCVIGFRGWMPAQMTRFWLDFAPALFNANAGELYLFIDEVHNFAPKGRVMDPEAGKSLHWTNRLMSEGRGVGLVCLIASQRPQKVHNDTLTCCESLIAMRVIHAADRQAMKDWIDGCGDPAQGKEMLAQVASLPRGEAYVWSPEIGFGPQRTKFPMFETFDSFAPPQLQKKVSDRGWEGKDLEAIKEKLAKVIEEEKANDPRELKTKISKLHAEIAALTVKGKIREEMPPAPVKIERVEVAVFDAEARKEIIELATQCADMARSVAKLSHDVFHRLDQIDQKKAIVFALKSYRDESRPQNIIGRTVRAPAQRFTKAEMTGGDSGLDANRQKILDVFAMLEQRRISTNRDTVARWLDLHPTGGRYGTNLGWLRAEGYLDGSTLTEKGRGAARSMATGYDAALVPLDEPQRAIMAVLRNRETFTRETLAAALGLHPTGGRFGTNLGRLRTMELIPERGEIYLTEGAFL
jgi:hypothetical protein